MGHNRKYKNVTQNNNVNNQTEQKIIDQTHNSFIVTMISMPLTEYEKLKKENSDLHAQILLLAGNEKILQETIRGNNEMIKAHEKTIEELKKENESLRELLRKATDQNIILITELDDLKIKHEDLTIKHENLNIKHEDLKIKHEDLTIKHEDLKIKHEDLTIKHEDLIIKHENLEKAHEDLKIKHEDLTIKHEDLKIKHENLEKAHEDLKIKHEDLTIKHEDLKIKHENLEKAHEDLNIKHEDLKIKHENLEKSHEYLKITNDEMWRDIKELKNRDEPITVREGFVSLEKYIMIEILGSKTKTREFYGVRDLFSSKKYETECNEFLTKYKITIEHIYLIPEMKEYENKSAHERPVILRTEFEEMALSFLTDNADKNMVIDLLKYLEFKNPCDSNGLWNIQKPY
ncbi:hypothetical protein BMW23_1054 [Bodo saltans virus]|uniref:Uncharacterized protein n=1 Tax=Bodo saltans virus TaxID=2024608 RepID=A0A2H4UVY0_9VIRU|nr:hypothetical protein QJ851_gp1035 [Bodo saltans virus]ATZ81098.1 hypothetical protein BMW23_1054 [Bodo saltans virus]